MSTVTFAEVRGNLESLWDEVVTTREPIVIRRRGRPAVAMIAADELEGLLETAHLLRSPKNAQRLLASLRNVRRGRVAEMTFAQLRRKVGLDETWD